MRRCPRPDAAAVVYPGLNQSRLADLGRPAS